MATPAQLQAFEGILTSIGAAAKHLPDQVVTGFLPVVGKAYTGTLMTIGRAVNGWAEGVKPCELTSAAAVSHFARVVQERSPDGEACPMAWVERRWGVNDGDYNTARSAFWRGIKGVLAEPEGEPSGPDWSSQLVWSNLYKIAPAAGGNPSTALQNVQRDGCVRLLASEIETFEPRRILFLTGLDWAAPFLESMQTSGSEAETGGFVEWSGRIQVASGHTARGVVACHPQGKPGAAWIDEVAKAFNETE
ncbi:MAG: hypothetical protein LC667_06065 [Thioalkalivibrio sp.]|nr:hypothetical protein [Thioalkalivibrio sp.]